MPSPMTSSSSPPPRTTSVPRSTRGRPVPARSRAWQGLARLTEPLPTDWLAFVAYDMTELMAEAFAAGGAEAPEVAAAFDSLLEHQPLRGAMALSAGGDRLIFDAATDAPTGPFAVENADRGLADEVPADTLFYSEVSNLGATLTAVIEPMKEALAETPEVAEQIDMAEAALGAEIEDLVIWIDDAAMAIGFDGSQPYGGLVLVPSDVAAAERRLDQLGTFASLGAMDPSSGITVEEDEVAGVPVTTIRWDDPNGESVQAFGAPVSAVVQYAVTDDRALIGVGEAFVERVLAVDAADSLASQARYTEAVAEFGGSENAGVTWVDLAGTLEAVEPALGPMLESEGMGAKYETEVRPWLLPLDRLVAVTRLEGDVLVQRSALLVE